MFILRTEKIYCIFTKVYSLGMAIGIFTITTVTETNICTTNYINTFNTSINNIPIQIVHNTILHCLMFVVKCTTDMS